MDSRLLKVAVEASEDAGRLLKKSFRRETQVKYKTERELVSDADLKSEDIILSRIRREFPEHAVYSEEAGSDGRKSRFEWVVDPLDGTHNFLYGMPLYGVAVAVLEDDEPVASAIHLPEFNETYTATKGGGAYVNGKPIHVSSRTIRESMLLFECQLHRGTEEKLRMLGNLSSRGFSVRILGVATVAFAWLARGLADFYEIADAKLCDVAAGALLVSEAGGMVTDFYGRPWNKYSKNVAASNGVIHESVIERLK